MNRVPSKQTFRELAEPIRIQLGEGRFICLPKVFSTGSFGWYHSGKMVHEFHGEPLTLQVSLSMVIIGSKDAPSLPGMSTAERVAEEEARRQHIAAHLFSPLYPVSDSDEKVRIDSKASSSPKDASECNDATHTLIKASLKPSEPVEATKRDGKRKKGGAK